MTCLGKAQRGDGGIASKHSHPALEGDGRSAPLSGLFTPGKDPVPIVQKAGWALGPSGRQGKSLFYRDSMSNRPARREYLYRLRYFGREN